MAKKKTFDDVQEARKHEEEIQNTRFGGLGGSDAAIVLKVGRLGTDALSRTDLKRLAVMTGQTPYEDFAGSSATEAGHKFEEYLQGFFYESEKAVREELLEVQNVLRGYRTFAHADFIEHDGDALIVHEAKFKKETDTDKVAKEYQAQLQWYYFLGATRVILEHGTGTAEPFEVLNITSREIEIDEQIQREFRRGAALLNDWLPSFKWSPTWSAKLDEVGEDMQQAIARLQELDDQEQAIKEEKDQLREQIRGQMAVVGMNTITGEFGSCTLGADTVARSFDNAKLLKAHPELDLPEFYKESKRAGALTIKFAKS